MSVLIIVLLLILGLVLIIKGGDFFVEAASWMAEISGIPKVIVGATIVSIATTLPEMLVSVMAAYDGKVDMSIGNAVGSVTCNAGLILALGIILMPSVIKRKEYLFKAVLLILAASLMVIFASKGSISVVLCVVLLVICVMFIAENVISARKAAAVENEGSTALKKDRNTVILMMVKFVGGAAGIVIGSQLLIDNGCELAVIMGISERVIAVTMVAVGTSLPELVTTITAAVKKESALSVGNIIGANILDLTLIMPLSSIISGKPLPVSAAAAALDIPACLIVCAAAVIPALIMGRFRRWQGVLLLGMYIVYIVLTVML